MTATMVSMEQQALLALPVQMALLVQTVLLVPMGKVA
jgi:hypothetical protein